MTGRLSFEQPPQLAKTSTRPSSFTHLAPPTGIVPGASSRPHSPPAPDRQFQFTYGLPSQQGMTSTSQSYGLVRLQGSLAETWVTTRRQPRDSSNFKRTDEYAWAATMFYSIRLNLSHLVVDLERDNKILKERLEELEFSTSNPRKADFYYLSPPPGLQRHPVCGLCPTLPVAGLRNSAGFARLVSAHHHLARRPRPASITKLRGLWRRITRERKKLPAPPPPLYDPHSYAQNFDDGMSTWEEPESVSRSFSARFAAPARVLQEFEGQLMTWKTIAIHYGTREISDFLSLDHVGVGDLVVNDQDQEISVGNVTPVWYNMIEQDLVKEPAFSFLFNRNSKEGEGDLGISLLAGSTTIIAEINQRIGATGATCPNLCSDWSV
ncbi:hypothetical protein ZIOFF_012294 [Zingiber officinale]|uniref:Peptidase A1 domain-containing protein n=1 Tax=Zingiber officinale TaxID=94328 RepID=A0A8J5LTU0_ZINOF|nr:hypothetical protein ZIOFF_012294 [Zingiber officinale]